MSGPVTMALGPFAFEAHGFGFTDVSVSLETPWAEIETAGRFNESQWTGASRETITISGVIFPLAFGGEQTLEGIKLAAREGVPLMLVMRAGSVRGLHTIEGVTEEASLHDRDGVPRRNGYTLTLKRYKPRRRS